jgi:hypothetical protein
VNTISDITEEQISKLRKVLNKHEKLFAKKLDLAKEPKED